MPPPPDNHFDFGFEKVTANEKTERVTSVFERVASRYDMMNDLMSLGIHRLWKSRFVESLPLRQEGVYLDVAGGTGDIAQSIHRRLKSFGIHGNITVSDINPAMIEVGKKRYPHLSWLLANAEELPLEDNSVDVYSIAFGLRNVTQKERALQEAFRVLKRGGKFACLEFSHVHAPLQKFYDFYSFNIIPKMGEWFANDRESYQYLSESIRTFFTRKELLELMKQTGFTRASYHTFTGGIVALHTGYKR
ncbi:MAG: bifunctional demethylmenaquinone methyltransferase/2-methoxy-6-polyprenyl-1,4-benzoquinol methylase UbiE [Alphaproteobacteria bacterium]|nr:bifunctional demethylmenaquinone methyltransferase/2-methoxy-6-polyprenyl-1,4-benzoquinol methylase UbiE [Alphaproteobacteria bacterium]